MPLVYMRDLRVVMLTLYMRLCGRLIEVEKLSSYSFNLSSSLLDAYIKVGSAAIKTGHC